MHGKTRNRIFITAYLTVTSISSHKEHIPLTWRYDLNPDTNPYFMERLGINAVMNSGAIELNGKYYLVARIGGMTESLSSAWRSDNGIDGFRFWDYRFFCRIPALRRRMSTICA